MLESKASQKEQQSERQPAVTLPVQYVEQLNEFEMSFNSQTEAVVWARKLPGSLENWLDKLPNQSLPDGPFIVKPADVSTCVEDIFAAIGVQSSPMQTWLSQDVAQLAHFVSKVMGTPYLRLRMEKVSDDACRRFHIDNVKARLICTYRGPGTQISLSRTNFSGIETIPTGMPIFLKGKLWPQAHELSLKHRSPPISGTGLSRLVLVLEGVNSEDIYPAYDKLYP